MYDDRTTIEQNSNNEQIEAEENLVWIQKSSSSVSCFKIQVLKLGTWNWFVSRINKSAPGNGIRYYHKGTQSFSHFKSMLLAFTITGNKNRYHRYNYIFHKVKKTKTTLSNLNKHKFD